MAPRYCLSVAKIKALLATAAFVDSRTSCWWAILPAMAKRVRKAVPEVPKTVFKRFLDELVKDEAMTDVVGRLKPVLLEEENISEAAIRSALLRDDPDAEAV